MNINKLYILLLNKLYILLLNENPILYAIFAEVNNLAHQIQNNGMDIIHSNGDHSNDEQFEDAD